MERGPKHYLHCLQYHCAGLPRISGVLTQHLGLFRIWPKIQWFLIIFTIKNCPFGYWQKQFWRNHLCKAVCCNHPWGFDASTCRSLAWCNLGLVSHLPCNWRCFMMIDMTRYDTNPEQTLNTFRRVPCDNEALGPRKFNHPFSHILTGISAIATRYKCWGFKCNPLIYV